MIAIVNLVARAKIAGDVSGIVFFGVDSTEVPWRFLHNGETAYAGGSISTLVLDRQKPEGWRCRKGDLNELVPGRHVDTLILMTGQNILPFCVVVFQLPIDLVSAVLRLLCLSFGVLYPAEWLRHQHAAFD